MFPILEKISSSAHDAIVDGDDLHITGSFEADEDHSSTVANASCHTRSFSIANSAKPKLGKSPFDSVEKDGLRFSKKALKKILRQLRQSRGLIPLRLLQNSSIFHSSTNTVADYEEIMSEFGHEEEYTPFNDSNTLVSHRSSRNDVGTGETMLVRQNAQVIGRPSLGHSNWDLSSSHSSDSKSYRNLMQRRKSLYLDDCSTGGMSDITEDTNSFYGFSTINHLSSRHRRTPMYIYPDCIDEDDDEDESDSEETNSVTSFEGTVERAYDFRKLSPLNDDAESTAQCDPTRIRVHSDSDIQSDWQPFCDSTRRRVHSDTDIQSDCHRALFNADSPNNFKIDDQMTSRSERRYDQKNTPPGKGFSAKNFEEWTPRNIALEPSRQNTAYGAWPFPRTRTYSDPQVDHSLISGKSRCPAIEIDTKVGLLSPRSNVRNGISLDVSFHPISTRRKSLPSFESREENREENSSNLRSRTYSDSVVVYEQPKQADILWDPRESILADGEIISAAAAKCMGGAVRTTDFDESPVIAGGRSPRQLPLHNERSSQSNKHIDDTVTHPRPATSSVLPALSHTNKHVADIFVATEQRMPLQQPTVRNPSPRTLNAASKIAAALRPAPAKRVPALHTKPQTCAAKESDNYYWGKREKNEEDGVELKDLCSWSSESFDDLF